MEVFALRRGVPAPQQSTGTTCGASSLVMARMLADPTYARRVRAEGFVTHELAVRDRTNMALPGWPVVQPPWPRALGTPPWGAATELARALGLPRRAATWRTVRRSSPGERAAVLDALVGGLEPGRSALLYVGSDRLPRHVTLLVPAVAGELDVYEPAAGEVLRLDAEAFVAGRAALGGWSRPWFVVAAKEDLP